MSKSTFRQDLTASLKEAVAHAIGESTNTCVQTSKPDAATTGNPHIGSSFDDFLDETGERSRTHDAAKRHIQDWQNKNSE